MKQFFGVALGGYLKMFIIRLLKFFFFAPHIIEYKLISGVLIIKWQHLIRSVRVAKYLISLFESLFINTHLCFKVILIGCFLPEHSI